MGKPQHWVTVERVINASAENLYAAWTDPELMVEWMGEAVEVEPWIGGSYRIENYADGQVYFHEGEYRALEPGSRIVQTFRTGPIEELKGTLPFTDEFIEVTFHPLGPMQAMVRLFNGWNGEDMEEDAKQAVKDGWKAWLDQLAALF